MQNASISPNNRVVLVSEGLITRPKLASLEVYVKAWEKYLSETSNGFVSGTHTEINHFPQEIYIMLDVVDMTPVLAEYKKIMEGVQVEEPIVITSHFTMERSEFA